MLVFAWQPQLVGDQRLKSHVCYDLVLARTAKMTMLLKEEQEDKGLRLVVQRIFTYLTGTLAALLP